MRKISKVIEIHEYFALCVTQKNATNKLMTHIVYLSDKYQIKIKKYRTDPMYSKSIGNIDDMIHENYIYFAHLFNKVAEICKIFMICLNLFQKSSWLKKYFN